MSRVLARKHAHGVDGLSGRRFVLDRVHPAHLLAPNPVRRTPCNAWGIAHTVHRPTCVGEGPVHTTSIALCPHTTQHNKFVCDPLGATATPHARFIAQLHGPTHSARQRFPHTPVALRRPQRICAGASNPDLRNTAAMHAAGIPPMHCASIPNAWLGSPTTPPSKRRAPPWPLAIRRRARRVCLRHSRPAGVTRVQGLG